MGKLKVLTRWEALAVVVAAVALLAWLLFPRAGGGTAEVSVSGEVIAVYPLSAPVRVPVTGAHGLTLTLVIEGGEARVEGAQCPDLLCQHHAAISKTGDSIVCLPAQVAIAVKGGSANGPDAVSG